MPASPAPSLAAPRDEPSRQDDDGNAARQAAERLFADYLRFWSSAEAIRREDVERYYEGPVLFYGRRVRLDAIVAEKQRFIRRWPLRDYAAIPGTLRSSCRSDRPVLCRVVGLFDFRAENPGRGRTTSGTGELDLDVVLDAGEGRIIGESSSIVSRGRARHGEAERD